MIICLLLFVLLQHVADAACPQGWLEHDTSCYLFSHDKQQWTHAAILCSAFGGGKLVEVESPAENAYLSRIIDLFGDSFWMGLSDVQVEGVWEWMDSKESLTNVGYQQWMSDQPNNENGNENCAGLMPGTAGSWNDMRCTELHRYICETSGPYSRTN